MLKAFSLTLYGWTISKMDTYWLFPLSWLYKYTQGSKKTWISAKSCPLSKKLSHFARLWSLLACLSWWFFLRDEEVPGPIRQLHYKSYLPSKKSSWPRQLNGTFFEPWYPVKKKGFSLPFDSTASNVCHNGVPADLTRMYTEIKCKNDKNQLNNKTCCRFEIIEYTG